MHNSNPRNKSPFREYTSKNTLCNKQQFELFYIVGNYLFFMNIDFHFSLRTFNKKILLFCAFVYFLQIAENS